MRNLKKVLALVIAFSMMLSVVAFAGYNDVAADADYAGAVELLSALDIIKGDDQGNFNPDNTITRAEMAAIICRALGLEEAATGAMGPTAFADVAADHWAAGYVNLASQNGIINGYGDGNFGPSDTVTYEQAVKMIVCALGYEPMAAVKGGWPTGYLVVANTYKVTAGATANATRANIAIMMANALETPMMDQTSFGADAEFAILNGKNNNDYKTLLTSMDIFVATGVVGEKSEDKVDFTVTDSEDFRFVNNNGYVVAAQTFEIGESNIMDYKNQSVNAYVYEYARNKFEVVAVVPATLGETITILSDDIITAFTAAQAPATGATVVELEYYVDGANSSKKAKIKVWSDIEVEMNNNTGAYFSSPYADDIELQFVENTGDNVYDIVVATEYISDRVDAVDADKDKISLKNNGTITFDFEDESKEAIFVDDQGNVITLADFAADDVVAFVCDTNKPRNYNYIKVIKLANAAVTGTVASTFTKDGDNYVEIDGKEYVNLASALAVGDEGTFYIGMTGKVIDFDASLAGQNYAYILEAAEEKETFGTTYVWKVKLLTKDGVAIYDITKNYRATAETYLAALATGTAPNRTVAFTSAYDVDKLVKVKFNAAGEIKFMEAATAAAATFVKTSDEFKADAQTLAGKALADEVSIFMIDVTDADDAYVTDISALVDEGGYTGFTFRDERDEYSAVVISDTDSKFSEELGWAIVTKIATSKDEEGEDITKVSYVQDEVEGVAVFNDDSTCGTSKDVDDLNVGDVFVFVADAAGIVSDYAVVATINATGTAFENVVSASAIGDETALVQGWIANTKKASSSKGEIIVVDNATTYAYDVAEKEYVGAGAQYLVRSTANKYTYNDAGRNVVVETGDFMAEDVAYADIDTVATVFTVLVRLVDDEVVDIYALNTPSTKTLVDPKVTAVIAAIDAIAVPTTVADQAAKDALLAAVQAAQDAFDALKTEQKALVTNKADIATKKAAIEALVVPAPAPAPTPVVE